MRSECLTVGKYFFPWVLHCLKTWATPFSHGRYIWWQISIRSTASTRLSDTIRLLLKLAVVLSGRNPSRSGIPMYLVLNGYMQPKIPTCVVEYCMITVFLFYTWKTLNPNCLTYLGHTYCIISFDCVCVLAAFLFYTWKTLNPNCLHTWDILIALYSLLVIRASLLLSYSIPEGHWILTGWHIYCIISFSPSEPK